MAEQGASRGAILTLYSLALSLPYWLDMLPLFPYAYLLGARVVEVGRPRVVV